VQPAHMSHPSRGAWIEIFRERLQRSKKRSHPSRGAWIEIRRSARPPAPEAVAPLAGCVD